MEKANINSTIAEEKVIAKVAELMEFLDQLKKYKVLDKHLKMFASIIVCAIVISISANILISFSGLLKTYDEIQRFFITFTLVLIPITGVLVGILFVRRKIAAVKTGEWKDELSQGFPVALKILTEIDWDESFDVVSSGRLGYAMYSLVKGAAYGFISFFTLGFTLNLITSIVLNRVGALGYASFHLSLLITFLYLRKDLSRRFNEIRAIDKLHWELRRFINELKSTEL